VRLEELGKLKNPLHPELELATFQLVAAPEPTTLPHAHTKLK
jgi:hypothetical protein